MLLTFRVTNHASIRDELELSAVSASPHEDLATTHARSIDVDVLPAIAIYGANASGKSNVIDALVFMRHIVTNSHSGWRPGAPISRFPFKLDADSRTKPTTFEIEFELDRTRFAYGFSFDDSKILGEWLYGYPKKRQRLYFLRENGKPMKFGPSLRGLRTQVSKVVRPNSLYLSAGAANNHAQLTRIYEWFADISPVRTGTDLQGSYTLHEWQYHDREGLLQLIRYADTGVTDLIVEEEELSEKTKQKFREFIELYDPDSGPDSQISARTNVEFVHQGVHENATLSAAEESTGTLAWIYILGPLLLAIRSGGILVVDELDAYLHPLLAANLLNMFQDPASNPRGAQIIFNTHNVTLLGPSSPRRLSRDQVWFAEKSPQGVTKLTPLTEWRVRDGLDNVEKRYLDGRYGAIPFLNDTSLEVFWSTANGEREATGA